MLKFATGVTLVIFAFFRTILSTVFRAIFAAGGTLIRGILITVWWVLCLLGRKSGAIIGFGAGLALVLLASKTILPVVTDWRAGYLAERDATKEERAFEEAAEDANESAAKLKIAERLRGLLGDSGTKLLNINERTFEMVTDPVGVSITIDGFEVFREADMAERGPSVYRGLGEWESMLDAAEDWITMSEVNASFGDLPGRSQEEENK